MPEIDQLKMPAALFGKKGSRRDFLRNTAVAALAGTALAACGVDKSEAQTASVSDADHSGGTMAPNNCNNPGTWAFHCHILPHAESDHGMFGMVTALIVK